MEEVARAPLFCGSVLHPNQKHFCLPRNLVSRKIPELIPGNKLRWAFMRSVNNVVVNHVVNSGLSES
jgi:hypothetical protein